MKNDENNQNEPYFYIALVLKGSEKQYVNLLKYINNRNGAKIVYQRKSLTYLRVVQDDNLRFAVAADQVQLKGVSP
jgi:hypothetical protein